MVSTCLKKPIFRSSFRCILKNPILVTPFVTNNSLSVCSPADPKPVEAEESRKWMRAMHFCRILQ